MKNRAQIHRSLSSCNVLPSQQNRIGDSVPFPIPMQSSSRHRLYRRNSVNVATVQLNTLREDGESGTNESFFQRERMNEAARLSSLGEIEFDNASERKRRSQMARQVRRLNASKWEDLAARIDFIFFVLCMLFSFLLPLFLFLPYTVFDETCPELTQ